MTPTYNDTTDLQAFRNDTAFFSKNMLLILDVKTDFKTLSGFIHGP